MAREDLFRVSNKPKESYLPVSHCYLYFVGNFVVCV